MGSTTLLYKEKFLESVRKLCSRIRYLYIDEVVMTQTWNASITTDRYVRAAQLADVQASGSLLVHLEKQSIALFYANHQVYAIDNRCPHMGFPLHGSTCKDGIVTCPWHYARFDLASGGTFDA